MIVYLLLHEPTEMGYVGSTESSIEKCFSNHWKSRNRRGAPLYRAMRGTAPREWIRVVLEEYHDVESMLWGEIEWMLKLETVHPKVGFNCQLPSLTDIEQRVKRSAGAAAAAGRRPAPRRREDMTLEELQFYRTHGLAGASKSLELPLHNQPTHEERVENGKRGAEAFWSRPDSKRLHKEKILPAMQAGRRSWWHSLSEEERERHRELGRQAGKRSTSKGEQPQKEGALLEDARKTHNEA